MPKESVPLAAARCQEVGDPQARFCSRGERMGMFLRAVRPLSEELGPDLHLPW
jgi:hypothetical protein